MAQPPPQRATLTEAVVVERAMGRPALHDAIDGRVDVARAGSVREGLWPNPQISYAREQTYGPGGTGEDYLSLSQRIDISGRRGLRSQAADLRATAAQEHGRGRHARVGVRVRLHFYEVLRLQGQVAALVGLKGRLLSALHAVTRREAAGDASAYDRRRLERELSNARAEESTFEADRDRSWASLAALIGDERERSAAWPRVVGALLPPVPPTLAAALHEVEGHPRFRALEAVAAAAQLDGKAATRWWIPGFTLGGGYKTIGFSGNRIHGLLAMASISLPVFNRRQDESLRAQAEHRQAQGERALVLAFAQGEARGLWAKAQVLRQAARRFRQASEDNSIGLVRSAEAGYRGGELGVLELLDAYRGAAQDQERAYDLDFQARRARIELEFSIGGYAP